MDLRVNHIFQEEMKGDTSFKEKKTGLDILFGRAMYHQHEMLETWNKGIKLGISLGLKRASLEGQKIELNQNTLDKKHKEFLLKFYELANEYNCAIQHHPELGMVVVSRKSNTVKNIVNKH